MYWTLDERTRVVALSHVAFWNGFRLDMQAIGDECRRRGIVFAVDVMQSGLLLLLVGFASYFGLSWRSPAYGFAFGLGIFASVDLATETVRVWTGPVPDFDFVTMATYHCCVVIWLVYLLTPEMARRAAKELPENNLEQWNAELQRLLLQ